MTDRHPTPPALPWKVDPPAGWPVGGVDGRVGGGGWRMIYYSFDIGSSEWERETTSLGWDLGSLPCPLLSDIVPRIANTSPVKLWEWH